MINLDVMQARRTECMQNLAEAIKSGDETAMQNAMESLGNYYSEVISNTMSGAIESADRTILAGRGIRQLTSEETKFYQSFINAAKSNNPKQAISNIEVAFPETVMDTVMEDILAEHPLLDAVDFRNTTAVTKMIINTKGIQQATWGSINGQITTQLQGAIEAVDVTLCKLTAFFYLSQDMLDAGPAWVDRYVRAVLTDALATGAEEGIINGEGKDEPIGMIMDIASGPDGTTHKYSAKTATAITELTPAAYGTILANCAKIPAGNGEVQRYRPIENVIMVVNPEDYLKIVMPATTVMGPDGTYKNDVLPFPTKVIQSVCVPSGKAVVGLGKKYFFGSGMGKNGKLEYSDEHEFLNDFRTYKIKLLANGRPYDDNAFQYLDISGLAPTYLRVKVEGTVSTDEVEA